MSKIANSQRPWNETTKLTALLEFRVAFSYLASWTAGGEIVFGNSVSIWNPTKGSVRHLRTNRHKSVFEPRTEFIGSVNCIATGHGDTLFVGTDSQALDRSGRCSRRLYIHPHRSSGMYPSHSSTCHQPPRRSNRPSIFRR